MHDMDEIYKKYARMVYRFLFARTGNHDLAEELTQETFYRAVYSLKTYDGTCKVSTWLCQIAKHVWMRELEKRKKYQTGELPENLVSNEAGLEEKMILAEQKLDIIKSLHEMKEPVREVMYLRLFGELSFKEIGEILGQSENWARVTFYRGKKGLLKGKERRDET